MTFKIDQFYMDSVYGTMKYLGVKDGNHLFDRYIKSYDGWLPMGQRVNLDPEFQDRRNEAGRTRQILPPQ